jgi:methyltransferase (TIGR00027 family)
MNEKQTSVPDSTAVRVALWRAMHVQIDSSPHIFEDEIGLRLAAPSAEWRQRPDMHPEGTRGYRASIVARSRFIEDLVVEQLQQGVRQYVILGAGLDSFAQRRPEIGKHLRVFEIDKPETQEWKRCRLMELGFGVAENLRLVSVDFESGESWKKKLVASGFDPSQPAVLASAGLSLYLTKEANKAALEEIALFAPGSMLVMTFILPLELIDPKERAQHEMIYERARAAGTPFISFFAPTEITMLAREAGFKAAKHISRADITQRYFVGRADGLLPSSGEEFLVAQT